MDNRTTSIVLVSCLVGVGAFALLRSEHAAPEQAAATRDRAPAADPADTPSSTATLPPGHPDIGEGAPKEADPQSASGVPTMVLNNPALPPPSATGPGSLTWKAPAAWTPAPNPSTMRLATYHLPRATGDSDDADVAITRAGGGTDANIERWLGQFAEHGQEVRTVTTVRGMKVTIVDVTGTFGSGGMMPGAAPSSHPGWTLLAAIVETKEGAPYFIKITGPQATVHAARPGLDSLVQSLTPNAS